MWKLVKKKIMFNLLYCHYNYLQTWIEGRILLPLADGAGRFYILTDKDPLRFLILEKKQTKKKPTTKKLKTKHKTGGGRCAEFIGTRNYWGKWEEMARAKNVRTSEWGWHGFGRVWGKLLVEEMQLVDKWQSCLQTSKEKKTFSCISTLLCC